MQRKTTYPRFLHAGRLGPERHWHLGKHSHSDSHEIIVVLSGSLEVQFPDQSEVAQAGDVLHYRLGRPHAEQAVGNAPLETIFIGWRHNGLDTTDWRAKIHDRAGRIATVARWLLEQPSRASALAHQLLAALLHEYVACGREPQSDAINRAVRYIHSHLAQPIYLADLADVAAASKYHFARRFRQSTGLSPMAYVRRARVLSAQTLLASSELPLRAVAPLVGFCDEFQLCRVYKQVLGQTPRHQS